MHTELGVPITSAGLVQITMAGGAVISNFLAGKIIKQLDFVRTTIISATMAAAALIATSFSPNFIFLCVLAIPIGFGCGLLDATVNSYAAIHYKAKYMNWLHCCWGIGGMIGPIIISFSLLNWQSWHLGYRIAGIFQVIVVILLFISYPRWEHSTSTADEGPKEQTNSSLGKLLSLPNAKMSLVAYLFLGCFGSLLGIWGSSYFVTVHNISPETAAGWVSLYFFGLTLGRFLAGLVSARLGNQRLLRLSISLIAIGLIIMMLPLPTIFVLFGYILTGLGFAPMFPCLLHEMPSRFGETYSHHMIGLHMSCGAIGMMLMPQLFGMLAEQTSYKLFPITVLILLLLFAYLLKRSYQKA